LGEGCRQGDGTSWTLAAQQLARLEYDPDEAARGLSETPATAAAEPAAPHAAAAFGGAGRSACLQRIAAELGDVDRLARAVEEHRLGDQFPVVAAETVAGNGLETALAGIWRKVLRRPRIGLNDNFFEAGGTSLKAVQVIAAIKRELGATLSIVHLFECPTVALLAAKIGTPAGEPTGAPQAAAAALRGQQRRRHIARQQAS
jgi:acyl carrier protein